MNLIEHYTNLYQNSIQKIKLKNYLIDNQIDNGSDQRLGLTLVLRPPLLVRNKIQIFLNDLKRIDPKQFYYRNSDMHITIMSIISCYEGFNIDQISITDYINLIINSIKLQKEFEIEFRGITASPSCVMVQGFFKDDTLSSIRDNLRTNFRNSNLEQTIDKRYSIQTAHSTVVRFRTELNQIEKYCEVIEKYRNYDFGTFVASELKLVCNDWYQRTEKVSEIYTFELDK